MPANRLSIALEASGVGIWDWSVESGDVWWSENLPALHGVDDAAFDGTLEGFLALVHAEDRQALAGAIEGAMRAGDRFESEFRVRGTDGKVRWIRGQGRVFRNEDGRPVRVIGAGLDMTSRREAEVSERAFGAIARASDDAIVSVTLEGIVTAWNSGAERLYGYTAAEMVGQSVGCLIPPARRHEFDEIVSRLANGERVSNYETERLTKDGRSIYVSISSGLLIDHDGRPIGAATISRDMTARRREEEWQRFLADASLHLGHSLDIDGTLASLASLCTPLLADWCTIHLAGDQGEVRLVNVAHKDAERVAWARAVSERFPYDPSAPQGVPNVFRTGQPELYPVIDLAMLEAAIDDPEVLAVFTEARLSSAIIAPMVARGVTVGVISLYAAESGRHYGERDLALAMDLAGRAAHAVDNAISFAKANAAERQLRLVANNLPALVSYVDDQGVYRFVNQRYYQWYGSNAADMVGRSVEELLGPQAYGTCAPHLSAALSGKPADFQMEVDYPVYGRRQVDVRYVPDLDGDGQSRGIVGLILDVTERERERRRSSRLQALTEALAGAVSALDVADLIVSDGLEALGAASAAVVTRDVESGELVLVAARGFPPQIVPGYRFPADAQTSFGQVVTGGQPILVESWAERLRRFPQHALVATSRNRGAFAALPLTVERRVIGALVMIFEEERAFTPAEQEFLFTLASICAQSLERARLYDAERTARAAAEAESARHALLAETSAVLGEGLGPEGNLGPVVALALPALADWCVVDLIDDAGDLRRNAVAHADPARAAEAAELREAFPTISRFTPHTVWEALNDGHGRIVPAAAENLPAGGARGAAHADLLARLGYGGELVAPLLARGRWIGALTFVRASMDRPFTAEDLRLAEELAGRIALALDNARLLAQSQASESRYRELFAGVAEAILVVDRSGVVREVNPSGCALLGAGRDDVVGNRLDAAVSPALSEPDLAALARSGEVSELALIGPDGAPRSVEVHAVEVALPDGAIFLAGLRDVTARRSLDRLRRDFLAMVTHDLRSPLAAIRAQAQLMRRRREYHEDRTAAIIGQTDRMARLIDGLADVVRMDAGKLELHLQPAELGDVVRGVVAQELSRCPDRTVVIETPGPVVGQWDADRVFQVIGNLVGNAINYSGADTTITVRVRETEREGIVEVADEGQGIAPEHVAKLFDRFYRAEVTGAGGLGLGLYIARLLVEAHGGEIDVDSVLGRGTTFVVRLPKAPAVALAPPRQGVLA